MRFAFLSAVILSTAVVAVPANSSAKQNGGGARMSGPMMHSAPRAPVNPPRFQAVKAGPLKGPAMPPPGFRDRSIPTAALPQQVHRHSLRGHHPHHPALRFGLGYLGSYAYPPYAFSYAYADPDTTYAQDPQVAYQRLTPAGQCWTQNVQVSPDRSRDVRITRC